MVETIQRRYLTELDFGYNAQKLRDADRSLLAIRRTGRKRLILRGSNERA
jgi:hypothetical protein